MKNIEQILKENKNTYLWQDKSTIDLLLNSDSQFIDDLKSCKCIACDNPIILKNEAVLDKMDINVNGVQIECKSCKQKWFIHKPVSIPKAVPTKGN